jgi:hypothetical protein
VICHRGWWECYANSLLALRTPRQRHYVTRTNASAAVSHIFAIRFLTVVLGNSLHEKSYNDTSDYKHRIRTTAFLKLLPTHTRPLLASMMNTVDSCWKFNMKSHFSLLPWSPSSVCANKYIRMKLSAIYKTVIKPVEILTGNVKNKLHQNYSRSTTWNFLKTFKTLRYRLCGLVVRFSGYRSRGPGFDSRPYQIFWEVGGMERGPLSLVSTIEELLE